jgi:hypothetical protein
MGKVATSPSMYRRGVPNDYYQFGYLVQGNYPIVQPQSFFNNFINFNLKYSPTRKIIYNNIKNVL